MENNTVSVSGKNFIKKLAGFSAATWVSFVLSFLSSPITTRLFSPEEVGKINLFSTYMNMFLMFAYLGLDQAYIRFYFDPPEGQSQKGLFTICLLLSEAFAGVLTIGIFLFWSPLSVGISGSESFIIAVCLALALIANIAIRFFNLAARMKSKAGLYSIQTIALSVINRFLYVLVAFWNPNHLYAIVLLTGGYLLMTLILFIIQSRNCLTRSFRLSSGMAKALFSFSLPLVPVSVLSWANNSVGQLFIRNYVSFAAIGIYTNAVSIANLVNLLQTGFNAYWTPFVYENYQTRQSQIQKVHRLITFCAVAMGLCIVLGQDIIYLLLGEKFRAGKAFFPFLLLSPICYTIAETTGVGINLSKKTYLNVITFAANVAVNILLCVILLPTIGVAGAAIASCASAMVMLIIKTILGEKYYACVTNFPQTFGAIAILFGAALINWLVSAAVLKYAIVAALLALLILIYRQEAKYLFRFGMGILRGLVRRKKQ